MKKLECLGMMIKFFGLNMVKWSDIEKYLSSWRSHSKFTVDLWNGYINISQKILIKY